VNPPDTDYLQTCRSLQEVCTKLSHINSIHCCCSNITVWFTHQEGVDPPVIHQDIIGQPLHELFYKK